MYNHGLRCSCTGCGDIIPLSDSKVEELADLEANSKFVHDCPSCGVVEHILSRTEKERVDAAKGYPGPKDFVHLHNHTIYSQLDGVAKPEEYFEGCNECDLNAFAITDHGSVAAAPDAYFSAKKHNVKYIAGCEIYMNDFEPELKQWKASILDDILGSLDLPELRIYTKIGELRAGAPELYDRIVRNRHLTVLAKDEIGYKNLIAIQNKAWETGFYRKPRVSYDLLKEHKEGLVILSGCLNGPLCHELRSDAAAVPASSTIRKRLSAGKMDENCYAPPKVIALEWMKQFKEDFGDDFYLEIQMPGECVPNGRRAFKMIAEIGRKLNQKVVLTNDCHYMNREDYKIQLVMMAVGQDKKVDDPTLFHVNSDEQFFKTRAQMRQTFMINKYDQYASIEEFEQYCDNTLDVAEKCSWFSPNLEPKLPVVDDADRELVKMTYNALHAHGFAGNPEYVNRMKLELRRFIEKRFSSYFLISADIVNHSRTGIGMPVGPARGSAGGSLVCYLLGIHEMDPIAWNLSFDRFLSPSRGGYMLATTM